VAGKPSVAEAASPPNRGIPVLWHLKVSHCNEKARWALDYKGVAHERRAIEPGPHRAVAKRLTGKRTFPILEINGEVIGDSTEIIARLEDLYPEPPLYPRDASDCQRALALEEFFDEELGPYVRRLVIASLLGHRKMMLETFSPDLARWRRVMSPLIYPVLRRRLREAFEVSRSSIDAAYAKVAAAGERFQAERTASGYLSEGGFSVADLTLAAMVSPAVAPETFPYPQPQRDHPLVAPVRSALRRCGLSAFAHEMYARHRPRSAEVAPLPSIAPAVAED
jgi:glutathione S-transferase